MHKHTTYTHTNSNMFAKNSNTLNAAAFGRNKLFAQTSAKYTDDDHDDHNHSNNMTMNEHTSVEIYQTNE